MTRHPQLGLGKLAPTSINLRIATPLPRIPHARLVSVAEPFDHADWLFEVKYDGFRAMAYVQRREVELISRKGNAYESFEPLRSHLATLGHDVILDGETHS